MAVDSVAPTATAKGVAIRVRSPEQPPLVGSERDMVAQALHPLLENAVRHAVRRVDVSLERREGDAVFRVRDDGAGVDPAEATHIFEPGASTEGGAGLGLPLARRLARACTGDIVLVEVDRGACFELRIPAIDRWQAQPPRPAPLASSMSSTSDGATRGKPVRGSSGQRQMLRPRRARPAGLWLGELTTRTTTRRG